MPGPEALFDEALRVFTTQLPALSSLTPLDYLLLITLGIFALDGTRRGLILGSFELIGVGLTIAAAVGGYSVVGQLIAEATDMPPVLTNLLGFVVIVVVGLVLSAFVAGVLRAVILPVLRAVPPLRLLDVLGGLAPGFVKGALMVSLFAAGIRALPMASEMKRFVDGSAVVTRTAPLGSMVAPDLPPLLGHLGLDSMVVSPPPQSPTTARNAVQFPPNVRTEVDPTSESAMLDLLNRERISQGLGALQPDEILRQSARGHSEEMIRLSYFAHESPVAGSPFDRMLRAGARFNAAGENLAYAPNVETAHRGLMNSPEHRKNILTPAFRRVGIGVVRAGSWGRMFTQNFSD